MDTTNNPSILIHNIALFPTALWEGRRRLIVKLLEQGDATRTPFVNPQANVPGQYITHFYYKLISKRQLSEQTQQQQVDVTNQQNQPTEPKKQTPISFFGGSLYNKFT